MNCITLMDQAIAKLESNNLPFIDKTETALGFLRSKGVLPINRASMNGHLHTTYSAMLVEAMSKEQQLMSLLVSNLTYMS